MENTNTNKTKTKTKPVKLMRRRSQEDIRAKDKDDDIRDREDIWERRDEQEKDRMQERRREDMRGMRKDNMQGREGMQKGSNMQEEKGSMQGRMEELMKDLDGGKEERRIDVEKIVRDWDSEGSRSVSVPTCQPAHETSASMLENNAPDSAPGIAKEQAASHFSSDAATDDAVQYFTSGTAADGADDLTSNSPIDEGAQDEAHEVTQPTNQTCITGEVTYDGNDNPILGVHLDSFGREDRGDTEPYCHPELTEAIPSQLVEVEMATQEDNKSTASTTASGAGSTAPGKRKKDHECVDRSEGRRRMRENN